jgi:hypothetical protein
MEILRVQSYRKGPLSNQISPLDQKYFGFEAREFSKLGSANRSEEDKIKAGKIAGRIRVESGFFTTEHQSKAGKKGGLIGGKIAVETGQIEKARDNIDKEKQRKAAGIAGIINGRKAVESGKLASLRTKEHQQKAFEAAMLKDPDHQRRAGHVRWHVNRGIVSPTCSFCNQ